MRLLNSSTFKFREFFGGRIPPYAALSHRWEDEEITFDDMSDWQNQEDHCQESGNTEDRLVLQMWRLQRHQERRNERRGIFSQLPFQMEEQSGFGNAGDYHNTSSNDVDDEAALRYLREIQARRGNQTPKARPGLNTTKKRGAQKVLRCCAQAVKDEIHWVWIDTCCINKSSSAELSEAINSMFKWYEEATVCYAYLYDVLERPDLRKKDVKFDWWLLAGEEKGLEGMNRIYDDTYYGLHSLFANSEWFTRGWTLQELLAPMRLVFFNRDWKAIGTKNCLQKELSAITGIGMDHLTEFQKASVAQKMSWASKRQTTRIEDTAYSLMGLFRVYMPPLYGEGERAFLRLQLEILRISNDETIFAWQYSGVCPDTSGLLAHSPSAFGLSGKICCHNHDEERPEFQMTNKGLRMEAYVLPQGRIKNERNTAFEESIVPLNCATDVEGMDESCINIVGIRLRCVDGNELTRVPGMLVNLRQLGPRTFGEVDLNQPFWKPLETATIQSPTRTVFYVQQHFNY